MATRVQDYGIDVALHRKMNSRYDAALEGEIVSWIHGLIGETVPRGRDEFRRAMKNGHILMKLINTVFQGTPSAHERGQHIGVPIPINPKGQQFCHMENIENFLKAAEVYGVPRHSLFQTVDLYEARNMPQVLACIQQLGTECQRNGFNGPVIGPRPTTAARRNFSHEQLRAGHGIIGLQAGSNQFASQKGMSLGAVRHIADIRCDDMTQEGQAVIGLQAGTNKYASQKGMSMGAVRHIADIRCDDMNPEGSAVIGLQMGTNKVASQKGMSIGGVRHIADIRCDDLTKEGSAVIGLQMGTNQLASQKGMVIGGVRHVADIRCDDLDRQAQAYQSLQMGPAPDQVASQKGMSFGAQRHITDNH